MERFCPAAVEAAEDFEAAQRGGIQGWSVGDLYPYIVVGIDNPSYEIHCESGFCASTRDKVLYHTGTFYYVQLPDGHIGSRLYGSAEDAFDLAVLYKTQPDKVQRFSRADWSWFYPRKS